MLDVGKNVTDFTLNVMVSNMRGFNSKKDSLVNIAVKNQINIFVLTETQTSHLSAPKLRGFQTFFRNRIEKKGGGVAVLVENKFANNVTRTVMGEGDAEFIGITFNDFSPKLTVICYYGPQENTTGQNGVNSCLADLMEAAAQRSAKGEAVLVAGDYNCKYDPATGLPLSKGAKVMFDLMDETGFQLMNTMNDSGGSGMTHYDRTSGTCSALDYVLANALCRIESLTVDEKFAMTPYYPKKVKKMTKGVIKQHVNLNPDDDQIERVFSDHCAILVRVTVCDKKETLPVNKVTRWMYGKPGGIPKYREFLENKAEELLEVIRDLSKPIDQVEKEVLDVVIQAKDHGFKRSTSTRTKLKRISDARILERRANELERFVRDNPESLRIHHRLWRTKSLVDSEVGVEVPVAILNDEGELLDDMDDIFDHAIEFNEKILRNKDIPEGWREVRENKIEEVNIWCLMEDVETKHKLTVDDFVEVMSDIESKGKNVYRDLINAGPFFRSAVFELICRIYNNNGKKFNIGTDSVHCYYCLLFLP